VDNQRRNLWATNRFIGQGPDLGKAPLAPSPGRGRGFEASLPPRPIPLTPFPGWKGGTDQKIHRSVVTAYPPCPFYPGKGSTDQEIHGSAIAAYSPCPFSRERGGTEATLDQRFVDCFGGF
jgi:hypothetical protein